MKQYLIDVPPPTISGKLHMGHVFSYVQMDFIARYNAIRKELVYPFCYDNNGLPTELLMLKDGITDTQEIIKKSDEISEGYRYLFSSVGMGFSDDAYSTFGDISKQVCFLSFEDLKSKNLIYKAETEYYFCPKLQVSVSQSELDAEGRFERSGEKAILKQGEGWFIDIKNHIPEIRNQVDKIKWHPEKFRYRLHRWIDEIAYDWSVSRERKYGISIPGEENLKFDTWSTSSLTPQLVWSNHTGNASLQCPVFDLRFQAHDIIRTWALFTIVKSFYHNDQIPWNNIVVTGHALSAKNQKLAKSAEGGKSPYSYLMDHGTAGIRYWASQSKPGTDVLIEPEIMKKGGRLVNKIVNAHRFLSLNPQEGHNQEAMDGWNKVREEIKASMDDYDWYEGMTKLRTYFWGTFCDKLIEASKKQPFTLTLNRIFDEMLSYFEVFFPDIKMRIV